MADSEEHGYHGTEMRNVTGESIKKRGCCTRHPFVCCCVLVSALVLAGIVGALVGAFFAVIESKVDNAIGEVRWSKYNTKKEKKRNAVEVVWLHHLM